MDLTAIKNIVQDAQKNQKNRKKTAKPIKAIKLKGKEAEEKETAVLKAVAQNKSAGVRYMLENALNGQDKWTILDITYRGKPFTNHEGKDAISNCDGVVFQKVRSAEELAEGKKVYVQKVVPQ